MSRLIAVIALTGAAAYNFSFALWTFESSVPWFWGIVPLTFALMATALLVEVLRGAWQDWRNRGQ